MYILHNNPNQRAATTHDDQGFQIEEYDLSRYQNVNKTLIIFPE